MKRKALCALMITALAMTAAVSCGTSGSTKDTQHEGTDGPGNDTEPTDSRPAFNLEKEDFDGREYTICCYIEEVINYDYERELMPDEETGEAVDDAVFKRNSFLMEEYNFNLNLLKFEEAGYNWPQYIERQVMSGDDFAQLIYGHVVFSPNAAVNGDYLNMYDIPNLDFDDPWWPEQSVKEMTVFDCMLTCASPMTYDQLKCANVIVFNKDLLEAYDQQFPYEYVDQNKWTLEKLIESTKGFYSDKNLDGIVNAGDRFGYTTHAKQNGFFTSCNAPILANTQDGGKEISVMTNRTEKIIESLYDWYYTSGDAYIGGQDGADDFFITEFANGNGAYSYAMLRDVNNYLRGSDVRFGIVPQPKFDEDQEDMFVFACPSLFSIPKSCQDLGFAGYIFNAMSYYGYYDIAPLYYEATVQGKFADTEDDIRMLELINDNLTVSFAYCYDNWEGFAHLTGAIGFTQTEGTKDMSSFYAERLPSAEKRLETVLDAFRYNAD